MKKLQPEEIPEHIRYLFHFDKQHIREVYKGRTGLKIERDCVQCNNTYEVTVSQLRADLKRGRRMLGKCHACRNDGVVTKEGYIWLLRPEHPAAYNGRYVPQHILVMEKKLGRYLDRQNESVHHINGDRADNRLENLQLRNKYHGKGQAWECGDCGSHNVKSVALKD